MGKQSQQAVLFKDLYDKPVSVEFTQPKQSSDGGVVLLDAIDKKLGLTARVVGALRDFRQAGKVIHGLEELVRQRIFAIACGYPDCDEAGRLRHDPAMKLVCRQRDHALASQPTLSRFENSVRRTDLLRMGYALTDTVIQGERRKRKPRKVRRITIDMDPTEDPTYGDQQLTFFSSFYDNWCYLPMITTIQFDREQEQFLVAPVLRPGNAPGSLGALGVLKRLVPRLRAAFPRAEIYVRMDGAFATPEVFAWLELHALHYVVNMARNSVLEAFAEPLLKRVRRMAKQSNAAERELGEARYRALKWDRPRRAIIKAEVVALEGRGLRDNPRFVITNLPWTPERVYRFYTARGDMENRIKELHDGLRFDLTSCTSFLANQLRNLLTAAAYILFQQLRYEARRTDCAQAQVPTLRERLIKIGARIVESVRRIWIGSPEACPWYATWRQVALRLGAAP